VGATTDVSGNYLVTFGDLFLDAYEEGREAGRLKYRSVLAVVC
jgi:hypothetical protein